MMTSRETLDKLISIRHYCFLRGVLGKRSFDRSKDQKPEDDFRLAFRTLNRLYVEARDGLGSRVAVRGERKRKGRGGIA